MKKAIIAVLILIALAAALGAMKLFVIGKAADGDSLGIRVEEHHSQLDIYIQLTDSAMAISNMQYRYEGTALHLTVYRVLASPLHPSGSKCLYYEITDETEVWVGNRLVWTAE